MTALDDLRASIIDQRSRRNCMRAWSTTNSDSPLLKAMAAEAGLTVSAYKRHAGELADDAELRAVGLERAAADAEARMQDIDARRTEVDATLRQAKADLAQLKLSTPPEARQEALEEEALDDELRAVRVELEALDKRLASLWDAIVEQIEADGFTVMGRSLRATPPARRDAALKKARAVLDLPIVG